MYIRSQYIIWGLCLQQTFWISVMKYHVHYPHHVYVPTDNYHYDDVQILYYASIYFRKTLCIFNTVKHMTEPMVVHVQQSSFQKSKVADTPPVSDLVLPHASVSYHDVMLAALLQTFIRVRRKI